MYDNGVADESLLLPSILLQPNYQEAKKWYKMAADQGDIEAKAWLVKQAT